MGHKAYRDAKDLYRRPFLHGKILNVFSLAMSLHRNVKFHHLQWRSVLRHVYYAENDKIYLASMKNCAAKAMVQDFDHA